MSAHKHTPGPWELHESVTHVRVVAADRENIWFEDKRCPRVIEDARLIAAAPELLEALITKVKDAEQRSFEDWLELNSPSGDHEAVQRQWLASNDYRGFIGEWREQLDAIAKATGEPA